MGSGASSVHAPVFYVANGSLYRVKVTTYLTDDERARGAGQDATKDRFIELAIGDVQSTQGKFVDVTLLSRDGPGKDRKIQSGIPALAGRSLIITQTDSVLFSVPVGSRNIEKHAWTPDSDRLASHRPREFFVSNATKGRIKATPFGRSLGSKMGLAFGAGTVAVERCKTATLRGECVKIVDSDRNEVLRGDVAVRTSVIVVDKDTVKTSNQIVGENPGKAVWVGSDGKNYEPEPPAAKSKKSSTCTIL